MFKLGPTGKFPRGKLDPSDEGELSIAITHVKDIVRVDFGYPIAWIGMTTDLTRDFAKRLIEHADAIDKKV